MTASSPIDVLGLGIVTVDDFLYVDTYPQSDAKTRISRRERRLGGLTGNALLTAALMGARCAYVGRLGDDELSGFIRAEMRTAGIDLGGVDPVCKTAPIHSTIIVAEATGSRTIFFELPEGLRFGGEWPPREIIEQARVVLVDHYDADRTIRAARIARSAGIPIVADFERDEGPRFQELLELPDHLILSESFATRLCGHNEPRECLERLKPRARAATIVTCGALGGWYQLKGGEPARFLAHPIRARDTTACGDVFHGAYAAEIARGAEVIDAIAFANAAAALKAGGSGIRETLRDRATVAALARAQVTE